MIFTNLTPNMVVLTLHYMISTNTPAFQKYAFDTMFQSATGMIASWHLDASQPIDTNRVIGFNAVAYPAGAGGGMSIDGVYGFMWLYGGLPTFDDMRYSCITFLTDNIETNNAAFERILSMSNHLDMSGALRLATDRMHAVGVSLDRPGVGKLKRQRQLQYKSKSGRVFSLPYFEFDWVGKEAECGVDVSGICQNIVHFSYAGSDHLRLAKPNNYFELLGLPNNPIFVRPKKQPTGSPLVYELVQ